MTIPEKWIKLAQAPVDSPAWLSSNGEEYAYRADQDWVVVNEKWGSRHIRLICRVEQTIEVKP